jgi:hypothetical protein
MIDKNEFNLVEIKNRIVAIVKFGLAGFSHDGMKSGEYFQVTIDPKMVSPSSEYIRFGNYPGDEIIGWQKAQSITIIEILGSWGEDEDSPVLRYASKSDVKMLANTNIVENYIK